MVEERVAFTGPFPEGWGLAHRVPAVMIGDFRVAAGVIAALFFLCPLRAGAASARDEARAKAASPYVLKLGETCVERGDALRVTLTIEIYNPTFANGEKALAIRVPDSCAVDKFGMWVRGRYLEGEIAPRNKARQVFEEYAYNRGVDPALLTWLRDDLCHARVFPIFPRTSSVVLLSYVVPLGSGRKLELPEPLEAAELATAERVEAKNVPPASRRFSSKAGETPAVRQTRVWAFRPDEKDAGYFSAELMLPAGPANAPRVADLEIILRDTSASMVGAGVSIALPPAEKSVLERVLIDFDAFPHPPVILAPGQAPPPAAFDGGTDFAAAFHAAARFLGTRKFEHARIFVLSDMRDTCGSPDPKEWLAPLAALGPRKVSFAFSKPQARLALAGGNLVQAPAGQVANVSVSAATGGATGRDAGPTGVSELGNSFLAQAAAGGTIRIVGRFAAASGSVRVAYFNPDGSRAEADYPLRFEADPQNQHLPRLWARGRLADLNLEQAFELDPLKRKELQTAARKLALQHQLLSPWTSFLVLESERDFRESGVERAERQEGWAEPDTGRLRTMPQPDDGWTRHIAVGTVAGNMFAPPAGDPFMSPRADVFVRLDQVFQRLRQLSPPAQAAGSLPGIYDDFTEASESPILRNDWEFPVEPLLLDGLLTEKSLNWEQANVSLFRAPGCGWKAGAAPAPAPAELSRVSDDVVKLWNLPPPALACAEHPASHTWYLSRNGGETVLARVLASDQSAAWFKLTAAGELESLLPNLGLVYVNPTSQQRQMLVSLLDMLPYPTLFPLELLRGHFDVAIVKKDGATFVRLARGARDWQQDDYEEREYRIDPQTGLPDDDPKVRTWHKHAGAFPAPPAPASLPPVAPASLPVVVPGGALRIGFLDYASIWQRFLDGKAGAGDLLQLGLAESEPLARADFLARASQDGLAPENPAIAAFYADTLARLGQGQAARAAGARLRALLKDLPEPRRDFFRLYLAGIEARLGASAEDKTGPYERLAKEAGAQTQLGRSALLWAAEIRKGLGGEMPNGDPSMLPLPLSAAEDRDRPDADDSPEMKKLAQLVAAEDPRALAAHFLSTPRLLSHISNGGNSARQLLDAALGRESSDRLAWREENAVALAKLLLAEPKARAQIGNWLNSNACPAVRRLCIDELRKQPDWHAMAQVCLGMSKRDYAGLRLHRELAEAPYSLQIRVLARMRMMGEFSWTIADPAAYFAETIRLVKQIEDKTQRETVQQFVIDRALAHIPFNDWTLVYTPLMPGWLQRKKWDAVAAVLAFCRNPDSPQSGDWRQAAFGYVVALAEAGERERAKAERVKIFGNETLPKLDAAIATAGRDAGPTTAGNSGGVPDRKGERERTLDEMVAALQTGSAKEVHAVFDEVARRNAGPQLTRACIRRFEAAPAALAWSVFDTVRDEETAREALRAVQALRKRTGMPNLFSERLVRLCFSQGLLREAAEESARISATAPADYGGPFVRATALALLGTGEEGIQAFDELIAKNENSGSVWNVAVNELTSVRRYQAAFKLRQRAMRKFKELSAGNALKDKNAAETWDWLRHNNPEFLDNVVVKPGEQVATGDFRDQIRAARALGRWQEYADLAAKNLSNAKDDSERFEWYFDLRDRKELCAPLKEWLEQHLVSEKPLNPELARRLEIYNRPGGVERVLKLAEGWIAQGQIGGARACLELAQGAAVKARNAPLVSRCFRMRVDRLRESPIQALHSRGHHGLRRDYQNPPESILDLLDEALLAEARNAFEDPDVVERWSNVLLRKIFDLLQEGIARRPELRKKVDALAREYLKQRGAGPTAAVVCALTGWGGVPKEECWRLAGNDFAAWALGPRDTYLRHLRAEERWGELASFLRRSDEAGFPYPDQAEVWLMEGERTEEALASARKHLRYGWLIENGFESAGKQVLDQVARHEGSQYFNAQPQSPRWRFALHLWHGRYAQAADTLQDLKKHFGHWNPVPLSAVWDFQQLAFNPEYSVPHRKAWQQSAEGRAAGLKMAEVLLDKKDAGVWEIALAGACALPAAVNGEAAERKQGLRMLERTFKALKAIDDPAAADWLCTHYANLRWAGDPTDADASHPLRENLAASVAAAEALGERFLTRGLPLIHKFHGWDELPFEQQLELLRPVTRLLEVIPLAGPLPREGLAFPALLTKDDWTALERVPTPAEWLGWQAQVRRTSFDPADE